MTNQTGLIDEQSEKSEAEIIYDEKIAPLLMRVGELCKEHGLPFVAQVKYGDEDFGRTEFLGETPGIAMRILSWAAQAKSNVDALLLPIVRHANQHGHSSMYLHQLKIPERPAQ